MAVPIRSEANRNANVLTVLWICHIEFSLLGYYTNVLFLHGIRHQPRGGLPTTDARLPFLPR